MTSGYWRRQAKPIIEGVLKACAGCTEKEIRGALREAYPFGERAMWPYKVWLDEIKRQRGLKPRATPVDNLARELAEQADPRQMSLLEARR